MGMHLSLGHNFTHVSKELFRKHLINNVINFDEDINGNNGLEYTREEAKENGFKSTIEHLVHDAVEKYGETDSAIEYVIDGALGEDDYYEEYEYAVEDVGDRFIVSIAYTS